MFTSSGSVGVDKFGRSHQRFTHAKRVIQQNSKNTEDKNNGLLALSQTLEGDYTVSKRRLVDLAEPREPGDAVSYRFVSSNTRSIVDDAIRSIMLLQTTAREELRKNLEASIQKINQDIETLKTNIKNTVDNFISKGLDDTSNSLKEVIEKLDSSKKEVLERLQQSILSSTSLLQELVRTEIKKLKEEITTETGQKINQQSTTLKETVKNELIKDVSNLTFVVNSNTTEIGKNKTELLNKISSEATALRAEWKTLEPSSGWKQKFENSIKEKIKSALSGDLSNLTFNVKNIETNLANITSVLNNKISSEATAIRAQNKLDNESFAESLRKEVNEKLSKEKENTSKNDVGVTNELRGRITNLETEIENVKSSIDNKTVSLGVALRSENKTALDAAIENFKREKAGIEESIKSSVQSNLTQDMKKMFEDLESTKKELVNYKNTVKNQFITEKTAIQASFPIWIENYYKEDDKINQLSEKVKDKLSDGLKNMYQSLESHITDFNTYKTNLDNRLKADALAASLNFNDSIDKKLKPINTKTSALEKKDTEIVENIKKEKEYRNRIFDEIDQKFVALEGVSSKKTTTTSTPKST